MIHPKRPYARNLPRLIKWRNTANAGLRGESGQQLLRELIIGLDAMDTKRLAACRPTHLDFHCALGVVARQRDLDLPRLALRNTSDIARCFRISEVLVREVILVNNHATLGAETPEHRWTRMREWAGNNLADPAVTIN